MTRPYRPAGLRRGPCEQQQYRILVLVKQSNEHTSAHPIQQFERERAGSQLSLGGLIAPVVNAGGHHAECNVERHALPK